jgi:hypothetical protein
LQHVTASKQKQLKGSFNLVTRALRTNGWYRYRGQVTIAIVLFCVAAVLYALGYTFAAVGAIVVAVIAEVGGWAFLMNGNRSMPKVEPPHAEAGEKRPEGR